jgi:hypothetical protein
MRARGKRMIERRKKVWTVAVAMKAAMALAA